MGTNLESLSDREGKQECHKSGNAIGVDSYQIRP